MNNDGALIALLQGADYGVTAEDLAFNFNLDECVLQKRLNQLYHQGVVEIEDGLFYLKDNVELDVVTRSPTRTMVG